MGFFDNMRKRHSRGDDQLAVSSHAPSGVCATSEVLPEIPDPLLWNGVWWYRYVGYDAYNKRIMYRVPDFWKQRMPAYWLDRLGCNDSNAFGLPKANAVMRDSTYKNVIGSDYAAEEFPLHAIQCVFHIASNTEIDDPIRALAGKYSRSVQDRFEKIADLATQTYPTSGLAHRKRQLVESYVDQIKKLFDCLADLADLVDTEVSAQEDESSAFEIEVDSALSAHRALMERVHEIVEQRSVQLASQRQELAEAAKANCQRLESGSESSVEA